MQAHLIEVTPTMTSGGIEWMLCNKDNNACGGPPNYPSMDLAPNSGTQVIIVSINDPSNLGINFAKKAEDAIWIQPNTKPTAPVIAPVDQVSVTATSKTLIITDKNLDPMTLKYRLNFVGPPPGNGKVTSIDPDIKNGGGKVVVYGVAELLGAFVIGAALVLAIAVLRVRRMRAHAAPIRNPAF
jgi:hypothetical protein